MGSGVTIVFPDDRVLIGIINRKTDLKHLLNHHWYRIPRQQMPDGIYAEYIAFFLSGTAANSRDESGVYYFARRHGLELAYRKDLLPNERSKKALIRADDVYYKVQFETISEKTPPITNPTKRRFAFIFTTWDRFVNATEIPNLYSTNDYYVDRIYHALRDKQIRLNRYWDAQRKRTGYGANVRIICEKGTVTGYTDQDVNDENGVYLDQTRPTDEIFEEIRSKMAKLGGPIYLPLSTTF
ncbi:MAG: hypothetical protein AAF846_13000 [Chloroflexota bacterium]